MTNIRAFQPDDLAALYEVSLSTGFEGGDASHLYIDPKMMGHIYAAPYAVLEPSLCLVAEDSMGIAGFVVGAINTAEWESRLENEWWPLLRNIYSDPSETSRKSWSLDEKRASMIHHPTRAPASVIGRYPMHLHLKLMPRVQGAGLGTKLFKEWQGLVADRGVKGIHIGTNRANERAIRFWAKNGFAELVAKGAAEGRTAWMGLP